MIKNWTLNNFKSVARSTTFEIAPLTVFVGPNSAGKSTVIQSILLIAQTLQNPVTQRPIILNGNIVKLGTYDDIVSHSNIRRDILLGFELQFPSQRKLIVSDSLERLLSVASEDSDLMINVNCDFAFFVKGKQLEKEILRLQPNLKSCSLQVSFHGDEAFLLSNEKLRFKYSGKSPEENIETLGLNKETKNTPELHSLNYIVTRYPRSARINFNEIAQVKLSGVTLRHFLPTQLSVIFNSVEAQMSAIMEIFVNSNPISRIKPLVPSIDKDIQQYLINEISRFFDERQITNKNIKKSLERLEKQFSYYEWRRFIRRLNQNTAKELSNLIDDKKETIKRIITVKNNAPNNIRLINLSESLIIGGNAINSYFTNYVKYLGPLRDEPKSIYPLSGTSDTKDIGYRGEHTAAVLDLHKNTIVSYIPSVYYDKEENSNSLPISSTCKLIDAVRDWMKYMGVGFELRTKDRGKLGHELKISLDSSSEFHDLTHVGVGVSQILPILVLSLLAEEGTCLIFEQPELHLHPRIQSRLADFFTSLILLRKQTIIETHSEYLINRLRYRAATSSGKKVSDSICIYFVEKEKSDSDYKKIKINEFGVIEDWPKGFFDENEKIIRELLKAGMAKRKNKIGV